MEIKEFVNKMVTEFGSLQLIIAIEELSELQKELTKNLRKCDNKEHIVEEIADVQLVLEELKEYFGISQEEIYKVKRNKVKRTLKRCFEPAVEEEPKEKNLFELEGE